MLLHALINEDDSNTQIQVQGYGKITLDQARRKAISQLEQIVANVKRNPSDPQAWKNVESVMYGTGVMQALVQAINATAQGE